MFDFVKILNSLCKENKIVWIKKFIRLGIIQNKEGIKKNLIIILTQLKGKLKLEEGSNEENRLVIIFNNFFL